MNRFLTNQIILRFMRYHYFRIDRFVRYVSVRYPLEGKKILDVGAENSPYKKYFSGAIYSTQDISQNEGGSVDYVGDFNTGLPDIKSASFDYILCTQVLEHTYNPNRVFEEFNRVLKKGGLLFLTTHMVFDEHMEPYDYFRFTKYGLLSLGEKSGFLAEYIQPQGGVFHVLYYILSYLPIKLFIKRYSLLYYVYIGVFSVPLLVFGFVCYWLDYLDKNKTFTLNYECIYKKIS